MKFLIILLLSVSANAAEKMMVCTEVSQEQFDILKMQNNKNLFVQNSEGVSSTSVSSRSVETRSVAETNGHVGLSLEPLYFFASGGGGKIEIKVADHFAINPFYYSIDAKSDNDSYYYGNNSNNNNNNSVNLEGSAYGLNLGYSINPYFSDSFVLEIGVANVEQTSTARAGRYSSSSEESVVGISAQARYAWYWQSHVNFTAGAALAGSSALPVLGMGMYF